MSLRILLIEDDAWLAETQSAVLVKAGYSVRVEPHAPAAIAMVDRELPDAIVLDVLLAGSTAFALLHELQSYADTGEIPIILCTNLAEQFELKQLKNYGVKRIVDKTTMHPNDIVTALKAILT